MRGEGRERRGVLACVLLQGATCRSLSYESPESLWQKETKLVPSA